MATRRVDVLSFDRRNLEIRWNQTKQLLLSFKGIALVALIGLAIRLVIAPFTSWTYDVYPYYSAAVDSLAGLGIYGHVMYSYPPLYSVITYPFTLLLSQFQDPSTFATFQPGMVDVGHETRLLVPFVTSPAFNLAVKIPLILGDLLAGVVIYQIIRCLYNEKWANRAFVLWFLNPLVILTGSIMGQFDVLPALMTLIALFFALRQKYLFAGVALGLGTLLKVYPAFLFIFYLTVILAMNRSRGIPFVSMKGIKQAASLVIGGAISLLTILPFLVTSGGFVDVILRRTDYQQFGGISVWSLWNAFSPGSSPDIAFPYLHITTLIYISILCAAILWAIWVVRHKDKDGKNDPKMLIKGNFLFLTTLIIIQPLSNPQHLIWLLPMLVLLIPDENRMEMRLFAISITGALFLISLLSINAFLYPLASYTGIVDVSILNQNIMQYYTSSVPLHHNYALAFAIFSTMFFVYTIFLPARYDPMGYFARRFPRKGLE